MTCILQVVVATIGLLASHVDAQPTGIVGFSQTFSHDFSKNPITDRHDKCTWTPGVVHIDEGGRFEFQINNAGPVFELDVGLRMPPPRTRDDWPVALVEFWLNDGVQVTIGVSHDGKQQPSSCQVVICRDTWPDHQPAPSVVRELVVTDGIVDGTWRFRYEQGLISCWREGVFIGRAHVPGINRELYGYTLRAATEWMECTSLTVRTNATVRKPTEAEQETWKKILNRDDRLRKLRSGEFDPAEFQTMEARREQYLEGSDQSNLPFVTLEMLRLRDEVAELLKALPVEPPDPDIASILTNIASVDRNARDYSAARARLEAALAIRRQSLNPWHPEIGLTFNNMGVLLHEMHDLVPARAYLTDALRIRTDVLGLRHQDSAQTAERLAIVCDALRDSAAARGYLQVAIDGRLAGSRANKLEGLGDLSRMSEWLAEDGRLPAAAAVRTQIIEQATTLLGANHPYSLYRQAELLTFRGVYHHDTASLEPDLESLAGKALELPVEANASAQYALWTAQELAEDLVYTPKLDLAAKLADRAVALSDVLWPEGHPTRFEILEWAGNLALARGDGSAAEMLRRAIEGRTDHVDKLFAHLSDAEARQYAERLSLTRSRYLSSLHTSPAPDAVSAYRAVLRLTSPATRAAVAKRLLRASDPEVAVSAADLDKARQSLANAVVAFRQRPNAERAQEVARAVTKAEDAERTLVGRSTGYAAVVAASTRPLEELQRLLPEGIAVVEIVPGLRLTPTPGVAQTLDIPGLSHGTRAPYKVDRVYDVFVLRRGDADATVPVVEWETVFDRPAIGAAVRSWLKDIVGIQPDDDGDERVRDPAPVIRRQLWEPIERHLHGLTRVVVISPASLSTLPWAALPGDKPDSWLVERYGFVTALNGQQLLADLQRRDNPAGGDLLLVGDIDYGPKAEFEPGQDRRLTWTHLSNSRREVDGVREVWPSREAKVLDRTVASKGAVMTALRQARYAVLSTHAYYEPLRSELQIGEGQSGRVLAGWNGPLLRDWVGLRVPSVECALVLSGANRLQPSPGGTASDGYLLGDEISEMDLSGLQSVVMTACESAVGRQSGNEGSFGLQRAFAMAGARSVVGTAWKVDDPAAAEFARQYHRYLWVAGLSRIEAFRRAQLDVAGLSQQDPGGSVASPRKPYYWAAFVLLGDWR